MDAPVIIPLEGGGVWEPHDVSAPSGRPMTLHDGLVYSKNTITAQLAQLAGIKRIVNLSWAMGLRESKLDPVPSLALGVSPVSLKEMVGAYSTIANGGNFVDATVVSRIEDRNGRVLATFGAQREPVPTLGQAQALELVDAMRGVVTKGTGAAIRKRYGITADVAGKTGTTQNNRDAWFIMMHPQLVAGARVGYNVTRDMGAWGTGAQAALPIVGEVFQQALRRRWIDSREQFGRPRLAQRWPYKGVEDVSRGWPAVREILSGLREQVRGMFQ
jgi:penicillin-binding protein 1A